MENLAGGRCRRGRGLLRAGHGLAFLSIVAAGACGRTELEDMVDGSGDRVPPALDAGADADARADAFPDAPVELAKDAPLVDQPVASCEPQPEICNGVDDDCDMQVDEGLPAVPCPGGGSRYCVAGVLSECPKRCEVCLPGSERICFISYCTYWGTQRCAADGRSFGVCREEMVPRECAAISSSKMKSPELEQCCIDAGYCCRDEFDLDGDGNRAEMLGRCDEVLCQP